MYNKIVFSMIYLKGLSSQMKGRSKSSLQNLASFRIVWIVINAQANWLSGLAKPEPNFLVPVFLMGMLENAMLKMSFWLDNWKISLPLCFDKVNVVPTKKRIVSGNVCVKMSLVWRIGTKKLRREIADKTCHLTTENPRKTLNFRPKNWAPV